MLTRILIRIVKQILVQQTFALMFNGYVGILAGLVAAYTLGTIEEPNPFRKLTK